MLCSTVCQTESKGTLKIQQMHKSTQPKFSRPTAMSKTGKGAGYLLITALVIVWTAMHLSLSDWLQLLFDQVPWITFSFTTYTFTDVTLFWKMFSVITRVCMCVHMCASLCLCAHVHACVCACVCMCVCVCCDGGGCCAVIQVPNSVFFKPLHVHWSLSTFTISITITLIFTDSSVSCSVGWDCIFFLFPLFFSPPPPHLPPSSCGIRLCTQTEKIPHRWMHYYYYYC